MYDRSESSPNVDAPERLVVTAEMGSSRDNFAIVPGNAQ